ncbi:uncharacterized protein L969DRAFT_69020 [Mixia osmundae IAM 14324]|uniref:uncharacterized protein n=1 Tax=Mixia osmundae (strain CBS 9802 / IAM 14324 / JCM 22182 / KY 12970) TaxID=764103 RepID=UPI0004A5530D|nr:uncharacterized protein L969DRAFT_69020 [Mixia osmundae IAM 14324]KEI42182.1 hypothetical protein L969DRAFT_69020 [Mixia osmundae IAM 14324]
MAKVYDRPRVVRHVGPQKNKAGLGKAIINNRAKQRARDYEEALHTSSLPSGLHSVTQETDLDAFLNTAQLAGTDFAAERRNITVISTPSASSKNPYLLTPEQEERVNSLQKENRQRLRVPRRPGWTKDMSKDVLERRERDSFLEWRRGLAELSDEKQLLLTPFERNLSVWRQLWRTLERSHLIVQIVDARNPLNFRCEDLETYVKEVSTNEDGSDRGKRKSLILVNKSDLLTHTQRKGWADYFDRLGIAYAFFSAADAAALQEERAAMLAPLEEETLSDEEDEDAAYLDSDEGSELLDDDTALPKPTAAAHTDDAEDGWTSEDEQDEDGQVEALADTVARIARLQEAPARDKTRVLSVLELEELFLQEAPDLNEFRREDGSTPTKLIVGLVGYPNVGKSSTINALIGEKKVSVSSTPGKTKNYQTIHLSDDIILCDCPGLVFPQFASTKAQLVCDGVLPIDQMREHTGPVSLVTQRIPHDVLQATYGLRIVTLPIDEGGTGVPTSSELLAAYSVARGFFTAGMGNPDESRSARYVLKDYVNGKLIYCHPPPGIDDATFNYENRDLERLRSLDKLRKKQAPITRVGREADTFIPVPDEPDSDDEEGGDNLDAGFFTTSSRMYMPEFMGGAAANGGRSTARVGMYAIQNRLNDDGTPVDPNKMTFQAGPGQSGKKHFKGNRRQKLRSGGGYD